MGSPVVHFEITGNDGDLLKKFYGELFEWKIDSDNPLNYGLVAAEEGGIGGGVSKAQQGPGMVTVYVATDDITASLNRATELGATVVMPETTVSDEVTIGLFSDPEGNVVGLAKM